MGLIGGVDVLDTMQRCIGGVLEPALLHWMGLGGFEECWFPLVGALIERWIEDRIDWWWCLCWIRCGVVLRVCWSGRCCIGWVWWVWGVLIPSDWDFNGVLLEMGLMGGVNAFFMIELQARSVLEPSLRNWMGMGGC